MRAELGPNLKMYKAVRPQSPARLTSRTDTKDLRQLYKLFNRFKALTALSSSTEGIDKDTFRRGVPMLSVEDNLFVDRVFEVLDEDGSGIIDWSEFVEAMSSLEKGSREKRTDFLFRVYDIDKDGGITRDELGQFFLSSLMVEVDDTIREVSDYFVEQVFSEIDLDKNGSMTVDEAIEYIRQHPEAKDIFGMFGRSMTSDADTNAGDFLSQRTRRKQ
ncbi:Calcium-dependent protein kinase 1 [Hondaea fermentalgiana]|uniref:Calcium-dependent protein kinase 1 n=1 Tax=Hondaea fermentalgiana TaxID=2315210 RepID=A0A2R5GCQ8_9STRA|nr:Calcium-dependent protein kinase 1 [Hondaea fermentalgiana]|eukprot:GBG28777.1 Calcium-dependent protein kinase 1 [Hondaea fermentalgiana]